MSFEVTVFDISIVDKVLSSLFERLLSSVLVDKEFELSDSKTLSTLDSYAVISEVLSEISRDVSSADAYESVTFTSLAYIVPADNATARTTMKVSNIRLFKIFPPLQIFNLMGIKPTM